MKTNVLLISLLCAGVFVSCTRTRNAEQQTIDWDNIELNRYEPATDTIMCVEDEEFSSASVPTCVDKPVSSSPSHSSNNYNYSSENNYSSSYTSDEDYWEEKRRTSPNDNYLLGFDEDVDDVHDMEIYMEDY